MKRQENEKFKITETDVIDIDRYITERPKIKKDISEKKIQENSSRSLRHFLFRMFRNYDLSGTGNAVH